MKKLICLMCLLLLLFVTLPLKAYATDVTLMWDSVTEADSYKIYRGQETGVYTEAFDTGSNTAYTFLDLSPGTHYFAVTASNQYGESDYSEELAYTIEPPQPEVPPDATTLVVERTGTTAKLTWTVANFKRGDCVPIPECGYAVEQKVNNDAWAVLFDKAVVGTATNTTVYNLVEGNTYAFRIKCINQYGETASNEESITIPAGAPPAAPGGVKKVVVICQ